MKVALARAECEAHNLKCDGGGGLRFSAETLYRSITRELGERLTCTEEL